LNGCAIAVTDGSNGHRRILLAKTLPIYCWHGAGVALESAAAGLDVTAIASALGWRLRAGRPAGLTGFDLLRLRVIEGAGPNATAAWLSRAAVCVVTGQVMAQGA
jgi:hypothetical protein